MPQSAHQNLLLLGHIPTLEKKYILCMHMQMTLFASSAGNLTIIMVVITNKYVSLCDTFLSVF